MAYYDVEALKNYIRQNAAKYGIDPNTALKVWGYEGLGSGVWQSNVKKGGIREPSYGPFQFLVGGAGTGFPEGMGNRFQQATGLDPRDPKNVYAMADYAMAHASQKGWGEWYGAKDHGIGPWQGIGGRTNSPTVDTATMSPSISNPVIQAASDITKAAAPTQQDLINKAVQLSTRRSETIPGWPGTGPSRGPAIDQMMHDAYVGNTSSPVNVAQAAPNTTNATIVPAGNTSVASVQPGLSAPSLPPRQIAQAVQPGLFAPMPTPPAQQTAQVPSQSSRPAPMTFQEYLAANLSPDQSSQNKTTISAPYTQQATIDTNNMQAGLASANVPQQGLMQATTKPSAGYIPQQVGQQPINPLEEIIRRMMSGGNMA